MASPAPAQVALPDVGVRLPEVALPGPVVDARTPALAARVDVRKVQVRARVSAHPDRLALDPRGDLIVRNELLAEPATDAALAAALAAGFQVLRHREAAALHLDFYVLQPPAGRSVADSLRVLRKLDPAGRYDFHHVLTQSGSADGTSVASPLQAPPTAAGPISVRIGLIDGGVATNHEVFAGIEIVTHGCGEQNVPSAHGTAVASLLSETLDARSSQSNGSLQLLAADVYCGDAAGGSVERVIESLAWLSQRQAPVINVSLVGPRNRLLERAVARVIERGHAVVAAVGNDGPAAPPLYPAAYEGVVGVSAVDRRGRALLEACRGPHVDFAALGADLRAAAMPQGRADVRGTSYAAPQVAAMLALQMPRTDPAALPPAVEVLARAATDLGRRGRDPVYGLGWLAVPTLITESAPLMSKDGE
jgi:hypothetical protein